MNFLKDLIQRMNTFTIFDYASYEILVFAAALLLVKLLPFLASWSIWLYILIIALAGMNMYNALYGAETSKTISKKKTKGKPAKATKNKKKSKKIA